MDFQILDPIINGFKLQGKIEKPDEFTLSIIDFIKSPSKRNFNHLSKLALYRINDLEIILQNLITKDINGLNTKRIIFISYEILQQIHNQTDPKDKYLAFISLMLQKLSI